MTSDEIDDMLIEAAANSRYICCETEVPAGTDRNAPWKKYWMILDQQSNRLVRAGEDTDELLTFETRGKCEAEITRLNNQKS